MGWVQDSCIWVRCREFVYCSFAVDAWGSHGHVACKVELVSWIPAQYSYIRDELETCCNVCGVAANGDTLAMASLYGRTVD